MSKQFWKWSNGVESTDSKLVLEGVISSEDWWGDGLDVTPQAFRDELGRRSGDLVVSINSPGGDVFAGVSIYNTLAGYDKGSVTVEVNGLAASIASVIAMAGEKIVMLPGSSMMIHKPWSLGIGNATELEKVVETLNSIEDSLVPIYTARTGLDEARIKEMLADETWMTPQEAVDLGFADEYVEPKKKVGFSDSIKNALNGQFAFSMSATKEATAKVVEKLKAEAEEAENVPTAVPSDEEAVEPTPTSADEPTKETESQEEVTEVEPDTDDEVVTDDTADESEEETKSEEVTETPEEENNQSVEDKEMTKVDEAAASQVVDKAAPAQEPKVERITKNEARRLIVDALAARYAKDDAKFEEINDKVKTLEVRNEIDGTTGAPLFAPEVLASDIRTQYEVIGRVGALVNRIDIEGAETFRQVVETAGAGFRPVALGAVKPEDQPVWESVVFEPFEWALIVAWLDGVAKRSPLAVYNQIVRYIARELSRLEDKIILIYAGGTVGSETRPATGLVPILTTAGRDYAVASYDSDAIIPALGVAYGEVESDLPITLVANKRTWAQLAVSLDGFGRPIFTTVGEQVAAGALGTFNVVLSNVLEDGDVVVGAYGDYNLVTRGGLGTLFSQEATVGDLNLFTQDASALRADIDITGGPVEVNSFYLLQFPSGS
jgi:ATP-dependent Clp protease, protease subunit